MELEKQLEALALEVGQRLLQRGETIATAESLTSGRVVSALGTISGASAYLLGGVTAYVLSAKVALLGVDRAHATAVHCVSPRVAREMACGVMDRFGADWSVATTGYAEPDTDAGFHRPGAFLSVCRRAGNGGGGGPTEVAAERVSVPHRESGADGGLGDRIFAQSWVALRALKMLASSLAHRAE